jgi:TrmH family RNA methyltransferase
MKMIIESKDNRHFKEFKKLIAVDGVRKYGRVIVSGKKLIKEIAHAPAGLSRSLLIYERYDDEDREMQTIVQSFADAGSLYTLIKHLYNELDTFNTNAPLLVMQTPEIPEWDCRLAEGCNLLIPFQDPVNVGAVIRSAAGFGVKKIILLKEAAHPFHPRCIRASSGAVFKVEMHRGPSITELNKISHDKALKVIALDMAGTPIDSFQFPESFLLLPGLEGQGVPEELKTNTVSIPISASVESLNAAIAASIALFACRYPNKPI